jgi:quercetin dioxygenase-like cupin family protein
MPKLIAAPRKIPVPGNKLIEEYIGRVNTGDSAVSIAHMHSPPGWSEPGQRPDFDEYTLVLGGLMRVEHEGGVTEARAGQAILAQKGEWVRYSTPEGAEYVAICLPAFSPDTVHRDS